LSKTADGIKVVTDKGEELISDVVLFATGIWDISLVEFYLLCCIKTFA
jgi:hypothetical protein